LRLLGLYIAREFFKIFSLMVASFVVLYTIFDFLEKANNLGEAGVPTATMISFFILQLPEITALMIPVGVLISTVTTLALMAKRNELVAIKSSGISMLRFTTPLLLISLAMTIAVALLNETVVPGTKAKTSYIWNALVEKQLGQLLHKEKFWLKGQNSIYRVGFYDPESQSLADVVYYRFDREFNLAERVDARRARYLSGRWVFFTGLYQQRLGDGAYSAQSFDELAVNLPEKPQDFSRLSKPSEEMSFGELARYVQKIEDEGYDTRHYRVDLHGKISLPFVTLIMALLGVSLALHKEHRASLPLGVVMGLVCALLYWISFSYVRSLFGYSGMLPPFVSAWLPNGIFFLGSLWFFSHIRQ
jgi:lipopolysaccharide export system permease protein